MIDHQAEHNGGDDDELHSNMGVTAARYSCGQAD